MRRILEMLRIAKILSVEKDEREVEKGVRQLRMLRDLSYRDYKMFYK
ncbi:hypothetical protein [Sporosarcina phage Lietuvens]|nr:hypothetical protein [Sporosarcina phage Lietuvens]